jgi:hypothetical protein
MPIRFFLHIIVQTSKYPVTTNVFITPHLSSIAYPTCLIRAVIQVVWLTVHSSLCTIVATGDGTVIDSSIILCELGLCQLLQWEFLERNISS